MCTTGDVVLVVIDVAPIWISAPHNALVASLPFNSVQQSCVTGPSKMPKCHVSHSHFCKVRIHLVITRLI
jgi:hypothetical protein